MTAVENSRSELLKRYKNTLLLVLNELTGKDWYIEIDYHGWDFQAFCHLPQNIKIATENRDISTLTADSLTALAKMDANLINGYYFHRRDK